VSAYRAAASSAARYLRAASLRLRCGGAARARLPRSASAAGGRWQDTIGSYAFRSGDGRARNNSPTPGSSEKESMKLGRSMLAMVACAVLVLAIPSAANAARVQAFGSQLEVIDNFPELQIPDNITVNRPTANQGRDQQSARPLAQRRRRRAHRPGDDGCESADNGVTLPPPPTPPPPPPVGGGGSTPPPTGTPPPYKSFSVAPVKLKAALKKELRVNASRSPTTAVKATTSVTKKVAKTTKLGKKTVVATGGGTCKAAGSSLKLKFSSKARKRFRKLSRLKLKITVKAGTKVVKTVTGNLNNKAIPNACPAGVTANAAC
jgi:hypothetical protein